MKKTILSGLSLRTAVVQIMAVFALTFFGAAQLSAQRISIQGTLKNASGASVADGTYDVTFKLYDVLTAGTALWEEDAMVEVIGGIYSHYLGSVTPLNPQNFVGTLYLGVKVGSYELVPRTELAYSPYAFSVANAQKVVCSGAVGDVKYSILNPTQFATVNGNCWVPMDGRALATTDQLRIVTGMTNVPNGGGLFLRSQDFSNSNQDPDRDHNSTIAQVQGDGNKSHSHGISTDGSHRHGFGIDNGGGGGYAEQPMLYLSEVCDGCQLINSGVLANWTAYTNYDGSHSHTIYSDGGSEARPKNLNMWVYIRIN